MSQEYRLSVKASREVVFQKIIEELNKLHFRVVSLKPFSFIEADFGSLDSFSLSEAKGKIKIDIEEKNSVSSVNLSFSFIEDYLADLSVVVIGELGILGLIMLFNSFVPSTQNFFGSPSFALILSMVFLFPLASVALAKYSTTLTKRKITDVLQKHLTTYLE